MLKDYSSDRSRRTRPARPKRLKHAAVFVDFESVYYGLAGAEASPSAEDPAVDVQALDDGVELLANLTGRLQTRHNANLAVGRAFADFDRIGGDAQSQLQLIAFEPRFALGTGTASAVDMPLCIEVMDILHTRPEIDMFVIVAGSRNYIPLVRRLREQMKRVVVVCFEKKISTDLRTVVGTEHFIAAEQILPNEAYDADPPTAEPSYTSEHRVSSSEEHHEENGSADPNGDCPASDEDLQVCMEELLNAFYQYGGRKVWLTPFLRLLNERFPYLDNRGRKRMVEGLQAREAISIEKIDGDPYPYSVVEINWENHWVQGMDEGRGNG